MNDFTQLTGRINELSTGFRQSAILYTAIEAEVFSQFAAGGKTADEAGKGLGWDPRGTRIFLDSLVALELLTKEDGVYRNTLLAETCLVPGGPAYQGNIIKHHKSGYLNWFRMGDAVRTGQKVPFREEERSPEELRNFILGMDDIARMSALEVLAAVDLSAYRHVLDAGGGPGSYSIAFLKAHPGMRATLFDLPDVVAIAEEQVKAAGLEERFAYMRGDLMTDPLGSGYDLILVSNIIHSFGPGNNRKLIHKCFDALEPGGLLILKDFIPENDRSGPPFSLLFALHMLIHTGEGDTYTYEEVASWTDAAGFAPGRAVGITPQSRLWLAEKPGARR